MTALAALTRTERARLVELESEIAQGLNHIQTRAVAIGNCLREIRDRQLYRETHATWTAYLRSKEHWGYSRQRAYQLLDYADVVEDVSTTGRQIPNERQARELAALPESKQRATVWELKTADGDNPSAAELNAIVAEVEQFEGRLADLPPETQRAVIAAAEKRALDAAPAADEVDARARRIARMVAAVGRLRADADKLGREGRPVLRRLDAVAAALAALPE